MNIDFVRAMSRATDQVRASDPLAATEIIRAALAGQFAKPEPPAAPRPTAPCLHPDGIEEAEIVEDGAPEPAEGPRTRRPLSDVIASLRAGRRAFERLEGLLPGAGTPTPAVPEGARYEWRSHAGAAGSRRYRLYVPACPTAELRGLVVMLHGCKQNPDDFAAGTGMNALAEEQGLVVVYPEQPAGANVSGCWNWFDPAHQRHGTGEPAILAALAREVAAEFGVPADRIFAAGLSAGGAMAAVLAETYPDTFAAVGIHSGLPHGSARDIASAFAAMQGQGVPATGARPRHGAGPRAIVFHGTADHVVHPRNAEAIAAGWRADSGGATEAGSTDGRSWRRRVVGGADAPTLELWLIDGAGHAWSGGSRAGSFTDPSGPSASAEMLRFFLDGVA